MNREILFRGKRVDNGEWVYGLLSQIKNEGKTTDFVIIELNQRLFQNEGIYLGSPVILETVGQFTGLTDKNGNKIFEGDHFGNPKFPVMFVNGCFLAGGLPLIGTIKGNIHDNDQI